MSPADLRVLLQKIVDGVNSGADLLGGIDPALIPFIKIGKALDEAIPGIAEHVDNWIKGNPPTQAELDDLAAKLAELSNPNLP